MAATGVKVLRLRHRSAPAMHGCRWCGFLEADGHPLHRWVPGRGVHEFAPPTAAQRAARQAQGASYVYPAPVRGPVLAHVPNVASPARTQL